MQEIFDSINWDKIGKFGAITLVFALTVYIVDKFLGIGIIPNLSQNNAVPLILFIFACIFLLAIVVFLVSTKRGGTIGYISFFIFLILLILVVKMLDNSPKAKSFEIWIKEYQTANLLDSVRFEIPNGEKGFSQNGLIQFEYVGSRDTSFQMKLSKKGYNTEYKKANNKDEFILKPIITE